MPAMPLRSRPRILLVNAALAGTNGNTAIVLDRMRKLFGRRADVSEILLADGLDYSVLKSRFAAADGFVFGTGTHWDSWSSVLQTFLEDATPSEGTRVWLGKPAAVVVTEHSVGGKAVLSRLQGVLVTFGCLLPPMSGLVLSRAALVAAKRDPVAAKDFWSADDLRVVCHNLLESVRGTRRWKAWPVDRNDFSARWIQTRR